MLTVDDRVEVGESFLTGYVIRQRCNFHFKATQINVSGRIELCYTPTTPNAQTLKLLEDLRVEFVPEAIADHYETLETETVGRPVELSLFNGVNSVFIEGIITEMPDP